MIIDWISVEEKLPEENKKVLAIWSQGTNGVEMITVSWNRETGWYNYDLKIKGNYFISYWTNLPAYPDDLEDSVKFEYFVDLPPLLKKD